ncbi:hypothetical protein HA402_007385 [Bradysia odoriphaga]|nr:hypothetical protein HA402_007385 [Bradysia odoriphaga]
MLSKIEFNECLKDSPKFRAFLEEEETVIDHLEQKLDKAIKMCTIAVDSGKEYVKNQSAFATSLWDLRTHFQEDTSAHNALGKIIHCLQEMNKFHTILLDQASRTVLKNLTSYVKQDIKEVKDFKHLFSKVSESLDTALTRNAQANKNRIAEVTESANILSATTSCFRHTALDYVNLLVMLQSKKRPEILWTLLSYYQACNTFYHQGSDLCNDFEQFFKGLADDINDMRAESKALEKTMQNRHMCVSSFVDDKLENQSDNTQVPKQIEGYLFKRTSKGFKTWNRRWFYLFDNQLVYKKRGDGDIPTVMEEDLRICTVRPVNDSDRRFCFEVISPTKSHILQADSAEILHHWISALHKGIGAAINLKETSHNYPVPNLTPVPLFYSNWEQFLKIPGNSQCCDCGHPEPRWASINLGITLCIACSGVHRSLGVHHSKVRSLTLDAWEPEIVKVMMELGNEIVNRVYEAQVDETVVRATENCDGTIRENWIKAKYVEKRFVLPMDSGLTKRNDVNHELSLPRSTVRKWSVRKLRRRPKSKSKDKMKTCDEETASTASGKSGDSSGSVLVIGKDLCNSALKEDFALSSDQESTGGEDNMFEDEDISSLTPNLLLYKSAGVHNLPVMCQAFALGASKSWTNINDLNRTALHQAILSGSVMACEYLLLNGIPIDSVDDNGYTALHLATEKGCTSQAYLLLKHRAKHDIEANDSKRPIDIAVDKANADIVTLLRLTKLHEEIGVEEQGNGESDTYNHVMRDFSQMAVNQPQRLQRNPKTNDQYDDYVEND